MVRCFVGITVPENIKRYAISIQKQLEFLPIKAKFVEPENLHISLSFLGDVDNDGIGGIRPRLDELCESYKTFEVALGDILLIPNENFTRVVALDVKSDLLETIRKDITKIIGGESHRAHLTLVRVKSIENKELFVGKVKRLVTQQMTFIVDGISLIESRLQRDGPVYTILHKSHIK